MSTEILSAGGQACKIENGGKRKISCDKVASEFFLYKINQNRKEFRLYFGEQVTKKKEKS